MGATSSFPPDVGDFRAGAEDERQKRVEVVAEFESRLRQFSRQCTKFYARLSLGILYLFRELPDFNTDDSLT
jgi:hypothetical protein